MDFNKLTQSVGELEDDVVLEIIDEFVAHNPSERDVEKAIESLQKGMAIVGDRYETREYFVGDLIFAGELLKEAISELKPILGSDNNTKFGSIVLGTVCGDLHDIGKNIFKNMAETSGFHVYDLGIDQSACAFVEKVKEVRPNIVGMSGVLTLSLGSMKETVDELKKAGLRDDVKIIIGGSAMTEGACEYIGADAFTTNASKGVKISQGWVQETLFNVNYY